MNTGVFVTVEGVDGAGKSTAARALAARMRAAGRDVVETREPGGTPGAEAIRRLLVEGGVGRWTPEAETLLFTAARADHVVRTIRPALAAGRDVLCDRYVDSTRAYQAAGRGGDRALVDDLHRRVVGLDPDFTLIFDLDPAVAAARRRRVGGVEDRFERFGPGFQAALRRAFLDLAAAAPDRIALIDAAGDAEAVAASAWAALEARLAAGRTRR